MNDFINHFGYEKLLDRLLQNRATNKKNAVNACTKQMEFSGCALPFSKSRYLTNAALFLGAGCKVCLVI